MEENSGKLKIGRHNGGLRTKKGATLIELVIALAIVGILAAVAIPVVSGYVRNSRMSEAVSNIAGILEAEEAFFVRFQRYTLALGWCPRDVSAVDNTTSIWPSDPTTSCEPNGAEWKMLGWKPESAVYFSYRVFSAYRTDSGAIVKKIHPVTCPPGEMSANQFAVNWSTQLPAVSDCDDPAEIDKMPPWVAVEAAADTDGDGQVVYIRGNSINGKTFRTPESVY